MIKAFIVTSGMTVMTIVSTAGCGFHPILGHVATTPIVRVTRPSFDGTATPGRNRGANNSDVRTESSASTNIGPNITEQLEFQIRDRLLQKMSSPGQGEDCVNASCTLSGTMFSGPSVSSSSTTLNMFVFPYHGWYVIVAPTTGNAFDAASALLKRPIPFPDAPHGGVMVVYPTKADYYWVCGGREHDLSANKSVPSERPVAVVQ